jgi:hypothetical protein
MRLIPVFDGWKEMIRSRELKLRTGGDPEDSRGLGVFCTEAALFLTPLGIASII